MEAKSMVSKVEPKRIRVTLNPYEKDFSSGSREWLTVSNADKSENWSSDSVPENSLLVFARGISMG